jgi:proteasome accessory factor B
MTVAVERLVNLALFLAAAREPVTAEQVRAEVFGYPHGQDAAAFFRMFERDKKDLARMGFSVTGDTEGNYVLDAGRSFTTAVELTPGEAAAARLAATTLLDDPSFPFTSDLRLALAKIAAEIGGGTPTPSAVRLADEDPAEQGRSVGSLSAAAESRKLVTCDYTNSAHITAPHEIEPYGLFLHDGRWYLVGRDTHKDETRTYTVSRMDAVQVNSAKPETPDFERPASFDISRFVRLPFQFGTEKPFEAELRFAKPVAWRASGLAAGQGALEVLPDGSVMWRVSASSATRLLRFVIENGPGIGIAGPESLSTKLARGLGKVVALHG